MLKKLLVLLLSLMMCLSVSAESPQEYAPLLVGGAAPYTAVPGALSEDGMSYDDGSLSVRIETDMVDGVKVYYVYVSIRDGSQLRTATAGNPRSKLTVPVHAMAADNNAVLAFNGDYYNYHDQGVVYRSGERIRYNIRAGRDLLVADNFGDLHIVVAPHNNNNIPREKTKAELEELEATVGLKEVFTFGPALIKDGERLSFDYTKKNSCGYPTPDERLVICQLESTDEQKNYLFIVCDGINAAEDTGLSVIRMTDLAQEKGALQAYNLDGGTSTAIYLCSKRINEMPKDRSVGDIIYFATLVPTADEAE